MTTSQRITLQDFVDKWRHATLKERSACQEHFIDLWPHDLTNEQILERLLALNLQQTAEEQR